MDSPIVTDTITDNNYNLANLMSYLPDELIVNILLRLTPDKILALRFMNNVLYRITEDWFVWKEHYKPKITYYTINNKLDAQNLIDIYNKSYPNIKGLGSLYPLITQPGIINSAQKLTAHSIHNIVCSPFNENIFKWQLPLVYLPMFPEPFTYQQNIYRWTRTIEITNNGLVDINSMALFQNVESIDLTNNKISDISALSNIKSLTILRLDGNLISDIKPLSDLTQLSYLRLYDNLISDIKPLSNLIELERLDISNNEISDITPLSNLHNLYFLDLSKNKISDTSPINGLQIISLNV